MIDASWFLGMRNGNGFRGSRIQIPIANGVYWRKSRCLQMPRYEVQIPAVSLEADVSTLRLIMRFSAARGDRRNAVLEAPPCSETDNTIAGWYSTFSDKVLMCWGVKRERPGEDLDLSRTVTAGQAFDAQKYGAEN